MEIELYNIPVTFAIIRNYYPSEEVFEIHEELERLKPHLQDPKNTGTAHTPTGKDKKENKGLFLDEFYGRNRTQSPILTLNRKLFKTETQFELQKVHWIFKYLPQTLHDSTLVSYYKKGDFYYSHTDQGFMTAIYYTWKEPKSFEGGDLYFGDFKVPVTNNCLLLFPSVIEHRVSEVTDGSGRWAITQFISMIKPKRNDIKQIMNFLSVTDFNKIQLTERIGWEYGHKSRGDGKQQFWQINLTNDEFYSEYLFKKIIETVQLPLKLDRVYANGQTVGQNGEFHQDSDGPNTFTFLLYTNIVEDVESWGGETQFVLDGKLVSYQPVPNSALFFDSKLFHRGLAPALHERGMRITVAWKMHI
jgi:Rps23 Pro-64 3,4-dihydroxylase Tpa1-like proline 4-hydroxylase